MNMTARNAGLSFRSPDDDDSHRTRYSELQQAFDFYNQRLFDGELPECLITSQRVTQDLFQGKFALSWFDRFSVQVEQQKEMAAVIDQWRETIAQAHQNAEPGLILKRCCQCHRRTGAMITICLLRLLRTSQKGTKSNISVGVWCCCLGEVRAEY
ncbi:hypothetical protein [Escherichia coli]|uniref:hypothetical protein n=1 Tax=Escherichia coli TaxID=562 RepID=UPI0010ACA90C|nr:hypothetical protein [Escherichia coli]TJF18897.1 hypothetical protein C9196_25195 [Escherichia coli]